MTDDSNDADPAAMLGNLPADLPSGPEGVSTPVEADGAVVAGSPGVADGPEGAGVADGPVGTGIGDGPVGTGIADQPQLPTARHGLLRYTVIRVLIFAAVAAVLWLVGIRSNPLILVALALVISGFISLVALNRTRDAASVSVSSAFGRMNERIEKSAKAEDDLPEA